MVRSTNDASDEAVFPSFSIDEEIARRYPRSKVSRVFSRDADKIVKTWTLLGAVIVRVVPSVEDSAIGRVLGQGCAGYRVDVDATLRPIDRVHRRVRAQTWPACQAMPRARFREIDRSIVASIASIPDSSPLAGDSFRTIRRSADSPSPAAALRAVTQRAFYNHACNIPRVISPRGGLSGAAPAAVGDCRQADRSSERARLSARLAPARSQETKTKSRQEAARSDDFPRTVPTILTTDKSAHIVLPCRDHARPPPACPPRPRFRAPSSRRLLACTFDMIKKKLRDTGAQGYCHTDRPARQAFGDPRERGKSNFVVRSSVSSVRKETPRATTPYRGTNKRGRAALRRRRRFD